MLAEVITEFYTDVTHDGTEDRIVISVPEGLRGMKYYQELNQENYLYMSDIQMRMVRRYMLIKVFWRGSLVPVMREIVRCFLRR